SETITVLPSSTPPLRAGTYYMAVANFGPGEATFTVTATVTGDGAALTTNHQPAIFNLDARLEGDGLRLDSAALARDGDFATAAVSLLDEAGRALGQPSTLALDSGGAAQVAQLVISGLSAQPAALRASLVLIDHAGNHSAEAVVDFSQGEA